MQLSLSLSGTVLSNSPAPFSSLNDSVSDYWAISIFTPSFATIITLFWKISISILTITAATVEREKWENPGLLHPLRPTREWNSLKEDNPRHGELAGGKFHQLSSFFIPRTVIHLVWPASQNTQNNQVSCSHVLIPQTIISGLAPFSKYSVTVSPFTSVGPGPSSSKSVVATLEGGEPSWLILDF